MFNVDLYNLKLHETAIVEEKEFLIQTVQRVSSGWIYHTDMLDYNGYRGNSIETFVPLAYNKYKVAADVWMEYMEDDDTEEGREFHQWLFETRLNSSKLIERIELLENILTAVLKRWKYDSDQGDGIHETDFRLYNRAMKLIDKDYNPE